MLTKSLKENVETFKKLFHQSEDLIVREFISFQNTPSALLYLDNTIDKQFLISGLIRPLQEISVPKPENQCAAKYAMQNIVGFSNLSVESEETPLLEKITNGYGIVMFEGCDNAISVDCTKWVIRLPTEPPTNAVLNGPREGFVEDVVTNVALMRKRLKTPDVVFDRMEIGRRTKSQVRICYINGIADPKIVKNIKDRLKKIDIDGIVDSNYLVDFLNDRRHSIFHQIGRTEKPDIVTAKVLEGRVAIMVDGSPIVLTLPFLLLEDFQSSNDYYTSPSRATFLRWLRFGGIALATLLPGCYVAVIMYHYKIIPIKLLTSISNSIQGIPFSPFLEVLFIIFLFEMLYEASLRMPRYLGLALSVIGALILGDTAVKSGLVSPPAVMIVALTGVMSYTVPEQHPQVSFLRIIFTIIGGVLGLYGIIMSSLFLVGYLVNIQSYGAPYLAPIGPYVPSDQKDGFIKGNVTNQITRPKSFPNINSRRLKK